MAKNIYGPPTAKNIFGPPMAKNTKIFMALPWPKTQKWLWPFNGQKYFNATANNIYGLPIAKNNNGPFMAKNIYDPPMA